MRLSVFILLLFWGITSLLAQPRKLSNLNQQLSSAKHDSTRLRLCVKLAQNYLATNNPDSLYKYLQQGLQILRRWPSHYYGSDLYYYLGVYYRNTGSYRKGIQPMQQAVYHAQKAHRITQTIQYQYMLAVILADANDLTSAVEQIVRNITYLQTHKDEPMLAANYLFILEFSRSLNNPVMENFYTAKYIALIKPSWPLDHRVYAYILKGELLEKKGQFKAAEYQYRQGLSCARQHGDALEIINMLLKLGTNMRYQHQYGAAIQLFGAVITRARTATSIPSMASARRELAITYLANRQPDKALIEARYALKLDRQNKQVDGIMTSLNSLVTVLEARGQYQEALQFYREQQQLREQRFTEKNAQQIAQMQAQFEAAAKDKTIKILQKNAQINQLKTSRQQQQITLAQRTQLAATIIIGLFIILTGVIYYFLRKSQRDYAALTRQQLLLQQTSSELSETNLLKDKLFSLISHDLRSSVSSVKTNVRQIREVDQQPELLHPLVFRLEKQVDNVLTLLTNLLEWSMLQLKGYQSLIQPICLQDVTEEAVSQASELIRQKQLMIINQVDKSATIMADKHQLQTVVRNILGNAIKFTPLGGFIRLLSVRNGQAVELQIRDSGLGMSAEQLATLFHKPELRPGTMGESGSGLGLQICREMLERQGGSLHVESRLDHGTLVRIQLTAVTTSTTSVPARVQQ